ncbi:hypothetical protein UYO_2900 [Lachnospiraceae bacterium JC7]|nr:hypothetical protein UYO_2900 [Lachnospiraceae bacterium JC7]
MLNEEISKEVIDDAARIVNNKVVDPVLNFVTDHTVKPTAEMLIEDLKLVIKAPRKLISNKLHPEHGQMSVKQLIRKDQGVQSVDIDGVGLGSFKKIANKYGLDFAIVKSTELDPPKYSVFFKARDADAITAVVNEFTARQLKIQKEGRTSILDKLRKFKEIVASIPKKAVEKRKDLEL